MRNAAGSYSDRILFTYVVDEHLQLAPLGVPGELLIAGDSLAQGYWQLADKTDQAFIENPFSADT